MLYVVWAHSHAHLSIIIQGCFHSKGSSYCGDLWLMMPKTLLSDPFQERLFTPGPKPRVLLLEVSCATEISVLHKNLL